MIHFERICEATPMERAELDMLRFSSCLYSASYTVEWLN